MVHIEPLRLYDSPSARSGQSACTGVTGKNKDIQTLPAYRPYKRLRTYEFPEEREALRWKMTTSKRLQCSGDGCTTPGQLGSYRSSVPLTCCLPTDLSATPKVLACTAGQADLPSESQH